MSLRSFAGCSAKHCIPQVYCVLSSASLTVIECCLAVYGHVWCYRICRLSLTHATGYPQGTGHEVPGTLLRPILQTHAHPKAIALVSAYDLTCFLLPICSVHATAMGTSSTPSQSPASSAVVTPHWLAERSADPCDNEFFNTPVLRLNLLSIKLAVTSTFILDSSSLWYTALSTTDAHDYSL